MRHFVNAVGGITDKSREQWEQARLISYWSSFHQLKKPIKPSDIPIPTDREENIKATQVNKEDAYKLLEKWNR